MSISGFNKNKVAVDILKNLSSDEILGFEVALDILKKYFPRVDIYGAVLKNYKNVVAIGKKDARINRGGASPFLAFYPAFSSKEYEKLARIELRSEAENFKSKVSEELGIEWDELKRKSFSLEGLSKDASEFTEFLETLNQSEAIRKKAQGNANFPDDYENYSPSEPEEIDTETESEAFYAYEETVYVSIKTRRGQPDFRRRLFDKYNGQCCVTGSKVAAVLEAAHIVPHSDNTDYSQDNGLLLRADVHTLYDLGLIVIAESGVISIAAQLKDTEYEAYSGQKITSMTTELADNLRKRLLKIS